MHISRQNVREALLMTLGTVLSAAGNHLFRFPNRFSMGGVTGLAVLLTRAFPMFSASTIAAVFNVALLVVGFLVLGRSFGARTAYCTLLFSAVLSVMDIVCPLTAPLTDQPLLELFFAVIIPAVGSALLFNLEASTGGTDIPAKILSKYTTMDIGRALLYVDVAIAVSALFVYNTTIGLYSILGLLLKSVLIDSAIESLNRRKVFQIITSNPDAVCAYITNTMHRGATIWEARGVYSGETRYIVLTAMKRQQAVLLRRYLRRADPTAFLLVMNSSEIFGRGFLRG